MSIVITSSMEIGQKGTTLLNVACGSSDEKLTVLSALKKLEKQSSAIMEVEGAAGTAPILVAVAGEFAEANQTLRNALKEHSLS